MPLLLICWKQHIQGSSTGPVKRPTSTWMPFPLLWKQRIQGSSTVPVKRPTSTWMPFPLLFAVIEKHIPASNKKRLDSYYDEFKV
ncbi:hypothetical protein EJ110_NYTH60037 [Nymphaea thermarum]|nr:hypothetical protein EJ110_NYTH60037 [Nymphaea thermarum]